MTGRRPDQTSCTNHIRHPEQVITKREESVGGWRGGEGVKELEKERERELKHHGGKTDGLKMKSPDLFEHYEDREQAEGRQK